ncbi:hypothetical protein HaLaN_17320 [Haematococcus lacustris]|uniref:Uncharacterized protein n=1 Tax=Haematococcus lacustris TaxID=44745 RepID=A0A699ZDN1_HAELA|nr:hypothetical protein HaLaN_17320 [Haematococcus lacustris]
MQKHLTGERGTLQHQWQGHRHTVWGNTRSHRASSPHGHKGGTGGGLALVRPATRYPDCTRRQTARTRHKALKGVLSVPTTCLLGGPARQGRQDKATTPNGQARLDIAAHIQSKSAGDRVTGDRGQKHEREGSSPAGLSLLGNDMSSRTQG